MNDVLNGYVRAYGADSEYTFDNEIMLNWYAKRLISLTCCENRVLDLGIGHGYTCNHFANYYTKYVVVDGSNSIIENFKRQYPDSKAQIIQSYFESFVTEQEFDIIIMGFVLEHVDNPANILDRFKKFLASNGRCFLAVPNAESLHRRFGHKAGLLPDMSILGKGDLALGHQRLYTVDSLTEQLQICGYSVVRQEGIFLKPLTTGQLQSLNLSKDIIEGMCKVGVKYPELSAGLLFEVQVAT
jgi:SAM-dependent methyltransferase